MYEKQPLLRGIMAAFALFAVAFSGITCGLYRCCAKWAGFMVYALLGWVYFGKQGRSGATGYPDLPRVDNTGHGDGNSILAIDAKHPGFSI